MQLETVSLKFNLLYVVVTVTVVAVVAVVVAENMMYIHKDQVVVLVAKVSAKFIGNDLDAAATAAQLNFDFDLHFHLDWIQK